MAEFPTLTRGSRSARALLLAFAVASLITLPAQLARAQVPPLQDCVANPASCLPEVKDTPQPLPEVDKCVANPASCLPPAPAVPPVDECTKNPASCLPEAPSVDKCTKNPASCLPAIVPDAEECAGDLSRCVPDRKEVDRCVEDAARCLQPEQNGDGDEDEGGVAAPVEGNQPPRSSPDATGRAENLTGASAAASTDADPASSEQGTEIGTALTSTAAGGLLERIERGLADAAKRFAFPLAVAALVGAFLLIQGRIDRRDPKLAAAPIASQDDLVSFR